jgi:formylglycine-generating enzyme
VLLASGVIWSSDSRITGRKGNYDGKTFIDLSGENPYYPDTRCWIIYNGKFTVLPGYENWPVAYVTWYRSKAFAEYYYWDLPGEVEWEYACRGGKQYLYGTDDETISENKACYRFDSGIAFHPVNIKCYPKNPFGLYDMCGNVREWCNDVYARYSSQPVFDPFGTDSRLSRVVRGGGTSSYTSVCRSAARDYYPPISMDSLLGFRVVRR